ncbi:hypothetical protein D3C76_626620 [compost metagenome]
MLLRALLCEIKGIQPEAKYFLVRFIQCFGVTDPVCLGVKDLAKLVGVTDRQVSAALDALVGAAILSRSSIPNERGRSARSYRVAKTFLMELDRVPVPLGVAHEAVIGRLLVHVGADEAGSRAVQYQEKAEPLAHLRARKKTGVLSRVNRLLFAVLLCGADRFGVVRNLGTVQICKATGLTKEMLRNRLKTLMDQALIRSYIPGLSSPVLSVKRKSVYYLNLNHAQLVESGQATSILGVSGAGKDHRGLDLLLGIRSAVNRDKEECAEKAPILKVLAGQGGSFYRTFQALLEEYAVQLLSRHWLNLQDRIDDLHLRQQILKDFRLPSDLQGSDDIDVGDIRTRFNDKLFTLAYDMALWFKSLLSSASDVPLSDLEFVILPQPAKSGHLCRAFLALPKADKCWSGYLMIDTSGANASILSFAGEQEIPLEELYTYGLLTRPSNGRA